MVSEGCGCSAQGYDVVFVSGMQGHGRGPPVRLCSVPCCAQAMRTVAASTLGSKAKDNRGVDEAISPAALGRVERNVEGGESLGLIWRREGLKGQLTVDGNDVVLKTGHLEACPQLSCPLSERPSFGGHYALGEDELMTS